MSDSARTYSAEVIRSLGFRPLEGPRHSADPVATPSVLIKTWLFKVSKTLQRGAIFQHKAVLSYLTCTYSCHVASKLPSRWLKIATWAQLGPTWLHLGLILCSQEAPRGAQEASKRPPRGSKRPPRGPKKPHLQHKNEHFLWEGLHFPIIPTCVQYVTVTEPPGPRSAG